MSARGGVAVAIALLLLAAGAQAECAEDIAVRLGGAAACRDSVEVNPQQANPQQANQGERDCSNGKCAPRRKGAVEEILGGAAWLVGAALLGELLERGAAERGSFAPIAQWRLGGDGYAAGFRWDSPERKWGLEAVGGEQGGAPQWRIRAIARW